MSWLTLSLTPKSRRGSPPWSSPAIRPSEQLQATEGLPLPRPAGQLIEFAANLPLWDFAALAIAAIRRTASPSDQSLTAG